MCSNGVNTGQFEQMIDQIDDHVKLERRWAHTLGHMAGRRGLRHRLREDCTPRSRCSTTCARMLDEAKDALEEDAAGTTGVTVSLV